MDKKGFTLIELMISISLLSIVLIFMMNTLVKLRDTSLASGEETNLLVGQAIISKTINNDIILNGGVSSYECTDNFIELTLMNNETRYIELNEETNNLEANTVITYRNPSLSEAILVRKLDDKYSFDKFVCEQINEDISRIRINFKENESIISYSEIFITKFEELKTIGEKILADNNEQSEANIYYDYAFTSSEDGTKGLYYTEENTEGNKRVYFYRGTVENNYLVFGNYCWRIVRTVEDGSVRLRYGGSPTKNGETYTCPQTGTVVNITSSVYNTDNEKKSDVNYKTSIIRTVIENWYRDNIAPHTSLTELIADTPYCNDMSEPTNSYFGSYYRLANGFTNSNNPQYKCPNSSDAYTVAKGDLTYPVGLLTADEIVYAGGGAYGDDNSSNYLYTNQVCWTMTPSYFNGVNANVWILYSDVQLDLYSMVVGTYAVVPVISLKNEAAVKRGTGAYNDPYIISVN